MGVLTHRGVVEQSAGLIVEERQQVLGFGPSGVVDSGADESDGRVALQKSKYEGSVAHKADKEKRLWLSCLRPI